MEKGSYTVGFLGMLAGVLLALLAIFIGSSSVNWFGGEHDTAAVHRGSDQ